MFAAKNFYLTGKPRAAALYIASTTAQATTITLPTHQVDDQIIIFAWTNSGSANPAAPTKPGAGGTVPTWTDIDTATGANFCSGRTATCKATATNHTSGTWTNATYMIAVVVRGQHLTTAIGGHGLVNGNTDTTTGYASPTFTPSDTSGLSVQLYFYGSRGTSSWAAAPAGSTRRAAVGSATAACLNTKDNTTSDGAITQLPATWSTTAARGYVSCAVEVLAA